MKIKTTCPYGSDCELINPNGKAPVIDRCVKYIEISTTDEVGKEEKNFKCADVWNVELQIMNNRTIGYVVNAVDEVRVQATKRQDAALQIAAGNFLENDVMKNLGVINAKEDS